VVESVLLVQWMKNDNVLVLSLSGRWAENSRRSLSAIGMEKLVQSIGDVEEVEAEQAVECLLCLVEELLVIVFVGGQQSRMLVRRSLSGNSWER
jgi:hypothetical protein